MSVSETLTVDVLIGDLGGGGAPSLSLFNILLTFDSGLFVSGAVNFNGGLDVFGLGSTQSSGSGASGVGAFELSSNTAAELDAFQPDSFRLFSVELEATNVGIGVLDLFVIDLRDAAVGGPLDALTISATVEVLQPSAVPVPAAVWLFGTALIGLVGFGKRKARAAA